MHIYPYPRCFPRRAKVSARRKSRAALAAFAPCEMLENRTLLTSVLYLDFGDSFPAGGLDMTVLQLRDTFGNGGLQGPDLTDDGFADANTLTFTGTQGLVNFDYDGSGGAANAADYTALRAAVLALAQRYYAPFDVSVQVAPALTNDTDANYMTGIRNTLNGGAAADGERDGWAFIANITSGGASVGNAANLNGTSAGVDINANNARDDTCLTFADVVLGGINATGSDADTRLAYTAAHEGGHDFGMRHTNWGTYFPGGVATSSSGNAATDADLALISASDLVVASAPAANRTNFVVNSRWDLTRGDNNNGGAFNINDTENHYNRLANGGNLGLAAGGPAYVTGTGAFDLITITPAAAPGMADVTVEAHRDNSFANQIGTDTTYQVPVGNILVEAGASQDRINISPLLGGTVRVRGMAGNDGLVVSGAGGITGSYTPNAATVAGLDDIASFGGTLTAGGTTVVIEEFEPAGSITVSGFSSFTIATGGGSDVVNDNTPAPGQTRLSGTVGGVQFIPLIYSGVSDLSIDTGGGNDAVTLDAAPAGALSTLAVNGGADSDTLTIDFTINPVPGAGLTYDGAAGPGDDRLVLRGGSFTNQIYVTDGPGDGKITFDGGSTVTFLNLSPIDDTVTVANTIFNADPVLADTIQVENGPVLGTTQTGTIRSASATFELVNFANKTTLTVGGEGGADIINLTATVRPDGLATLNLVGGAGGDTVNVTATIAGVATTVSGGDNNDLITVSGAGLGAGSSLSVNGNNDADTFDVTSSPAVAINVNGGAASDTLKVDGQALTYTVTNVDFTAAGRQPIHYALVETLDVRNGTFTVNVTGLAAVAADVRVNSAATLNGNGAITGSVTANAGGTIAPGVGGPGILTAGQTTLNGGSTFNVDLNGTVPGTGHDQLRVIGSVTLSNLSDLTGTLGYVSIPGDELVIIRNDGSDAVTGKFAQGDMVTIGGQKFAIDYAFDGDGDGNLNDVALIRYGAQLAPDPCDPGKTALFVSATTGDDQVLILPVTGSRRVRVVISNSGFTDEFGPFDFDGQIIAMGQSGNDLVSTEQVPSRDVMLYGNVGNDTIRSGNNNGILLGNLGNDILIAGNARDLLIGGAGADNLSGDNAGDILVAASTTYDTNTVANRQALCEIMHTWQHGGGMSSLLNAATVSDDAEVDILNGGNGTDWFIVDLNDVLDRAKKEVASDL